MRCDACGEENRQGARFCLSCGAGLALACPGCGADLPPGARFCDACGHAVGSAAPAASGAPEREPRDYTPRHLADKILQSKSALEGERKQVTVLFADVKGSLELAEAVDPEEWHRILERFFQILADGVHRFEGTVNQYTGDGIMALFGAPIAHEDHAQRACYAGLHLRDELRRYADELRLERGLSFSVRMGINSGEVIVGKIGDDLRMDYTAQGQTVGLAARMEQLAEPGKALLTEHTAKLAPGFFELRDLGASRIQGLAEAVHVFELEGAGRARTRLDVSRSRGFSKFVGRDDDLNTLEAALARSRETSGQVVGVVGEAGVGKSRLCYEFVERCRARGLTVLEGRAVAHGRNVPFLPILQVFRAYYGITDQDDDRTVREKVAGRLLLLDEGFREVLPIVFEFFGVPDPGQPAQRMDPEARQRQLFGVLRRLVRDTDGAAPGVTLIEDLHWMDAGSGAFLEQWVDAIGGARGLLLVNFRPEYHAGWMGKSYYQQLPLAPLGAGATRELVSDLLGDDPSTNGLAEAIHARTAGNPFFTEEVVQSLIESGQLTGAPGSYRLVSAIEALEVPASVQSLLAARIDRLPEREKQVLQAAAVIGREFAEPVLEGVAGLPAADLEESLRALTGAEFVYEQSLYPVAEYAFKHPLTQEVAYGSQLGERRARVHAAVARAIEELDADKLDERSALLAHHWEAAGEALEAARWHGRAAQWVGVSDPAEAIRHWRQVRTLVADGAESTESVELRVAACTAILGLGWRLGLSDDEAAALFAEGRELASSDLRALALFLDHYATVLRTAGDLNSASRVEREAWQAAERTDDVNVRLAVRLFSPYARYIDGRLRDGLTTIGEALAEAERADLAEVARLKGVDPYPFLLLMRAMLSTEAGRLIEAKRALDRALELARERGEMETLGWAHDWHVNLGWIVGDAQPVLHHSRASIEIAERVGSSFSRVWAYARLGCAHIMNEEWSEGLEALEQALAMTRERRTACESEAFILLHLAEARLGCGDPSRARAAAEEAVAAARRRGTLVWECDAHRVLAHVLLRSDGGKSEARIREALEQAFELAERTGARSREPFIRTERAELARLLGDEAGCERELREAHRLFSEMGATGHAERLARELGGPGSLR